MTTVLAAMMWGKKMLTFCSTYCQIADMALAPSFS